MSVSAFPRSRLSTRKGPLPIGVPVFGSSIPSAQILDRSWPLRTWTGSTFGNSSCQPEKGSRSVTRTVLAPTAVTRRTCRNRACSSGGKDDAWARVAACVKTKSAAVTGTPSLQRASRRMW
jgi:hypothetical protein